MACCKKTNKYGGYQQIWRLMLKYIHLLVCNIKPLITWFYVYQFFKTTHINGYFLLTLQAGCDL